MTTNNYSNINDESKVPQEISNSADDIDALKKNITILSSKNTSLSIAIEKILGVPTNLDIAEKILQHNKCSDLEKNNNLIFLNNIEQKAHTYCKENFNFDLDDFQNYSLPSIYLEECIATGENSGTYLLHRFTEDIYSKLFSDFIQNPESYIPFKATDSSLQQSELDRLNRHLKTIVELYLYKAISISAYHLGVYDVALMYHDFLIVTYSGGTINVSYDSGEYFKNKLSKENTKAADARWAAQREYRQQKKKEYMKIKEDQGFEKITDAANYIIENSNTEEELNYDYVYRLLREATNGNFN